MNKLSTATSIVGGALNPIYGLITSVMQEGFKMAIQFHKEGIAFARDVGLSAQQAQAYTNVLIERTQRLANVYGVSAEAILQIQRGLSEATGRQLMLNEAQAESIVQIDKLMGSQTRIKFQEEIINGMGGQIDTANKALANVYATAAKQGLVAKKLSDKVAQNLSMANRLSFRNGIEGITKMAALSEKLGFKMQSVESAASKFLDIDKAIENAAHMQMLGGSAAFSLGNPLVAAYEANYDPEAFAKRLTDSLASYATFDRNKGIANINGLNMDFVRQIGEQLGIGVEEAARIAKRQAEVKYKETALGGTLNRVARGNEEKRNYILNNAQITNNGRDLEINGQNIKDITDKEWKKLMHFDNMTDTQILEEQAKTLISIDEHISGAASTVVASFAEGIDEYLPGIGEQIKEFANIFSVYTKQWGKDTGEAIGRAMHWINTHGDLIKSWIEGIFQGITSTFNFFSTHWKELIEAIISWKALKYGLNNRPPSTSAPASGTGALGAGAAGARGGGPALGQPGGGGPRGGATITAKTENGKSYEYFNKKIDNKSNGQFRKGADGTIEEKVKNKWKPVQGKERIAKAENAYQEAKLKNPTSATGANGANPANGTNGASSAASASKFSKFKGALKTGAKGAILGGILSGIETWIDVDNYDDAVKEIILSDYSDEEKKQLIAKAKEARNRSITASWLGTGTGAATLGAIEWFTGGAATVSPWLLMAAYSVGDIGGRAIGKALGGLIPTDVDDEDYAELVKKHTKENHYGGGVFGKVSIAQGGIIGGNSTSGDNIIAPFKQKNGKLGIAGVNSEEMILNPHQQAYLFNFINNIPNVLGNVQTTNNAYSNLANSNLVKISDLDNNKAYSNVTSYRANYDSDTFAKRVYNSIVSSNGINTTYISSPNSSSNMMTSMVSSILENNNDVKTIPVGEKTKIILDNFEHSYNNETTVKVNNFEINGTIKLVGDNSSKDIELSRLLGSTPFVNKLKEIIIESINRDMHSGRYENNFFTLRNHPSSSSILLN